LRIIAAPVVAILAAIANEFQAIFHQRAIFLWLLSFDRSKESSIKIFLINF